MTQTYDTRSFYLQRKMDETEPQTTGERAGPGKGAELHLTADALTVTENKMGAAEAPG